MMDDLSPAAERALAMAKEHSADGPLNPAHLLLALIADDEGRAATMLTEAGGELTTVRTLLATPPNAVITLATVLGGASDLAGERAETTITGEYLLLGLLQAATSLHEPLRNAGVKLHQLLQPKEIPTLTMTDTISFDDPKEHLAAARIVDVNANRVREALRVLDDHCRFVMDDALLTAQVKTLRHDFVSVMNRVPVELLATARDTTGDVGTNISTHREMLRGSAHEVAKVNLKRLQEALRSLEEYGKLLNTDLAAGVEEVRYRAYTLERTLLIVSDARERLAKANLYVLLTGSQCAASLDWTIREAAAGGANIFQLREKKLDDKALLERARNVRRWTRETKTLFIMNDRPDIARLVEADGVHLGQDDMSVGDARKILGPHALIGVSTHEPEQVTAAVLAGANYIGIGPTFPSQTKEFGAFPGLAFLKQASTLTTLPMFAIGGINGSNLADVLATGVTRIAVSAAIAADDDPQQAAAVLKVALTQEPRTP